MNIKLIIIIILFFIILSFSIYLMYKLLFKNKDKISEEDIKKQTAQDFINVKDIKDAILFTNDKKAFVYLEIQPVSLEMMSEEEKKIFTKNITASLSSQRKTFKMLSFPKPIDLSYLIFKYENMYKLASTDIEKRLIGEEINKMKQISIDNSANEFKFYFVFWEDENNTSELLKRARDFKNNFETSQIKIDLISEKEIYRLCNMMNNPNYSNFEDDNYMANIPVIK